METGKKIDLGLGDISSDSSVDNTEVAATSDATPVASGDASGGATLSDTAQAAPSPVASSTDGTATSGTTAATPGSASGGATLSDTAQAFDIDEDDINIEDREAPIVLLFGPPSSGKSMTIVRLARYLRGQGYTVIPDESFKCSGEYKNRCEKFKKDLNTDRPLGGNGFNEFLMVKIIHHGKTVCQILEAPGEHYFNPEKPERTSANDFPPYMTKIIRSLDNRKIWVFITEAGWDKKPVIKNAYVERIKKCKDQLFDKSDRFIILYNKIDRKEEFFESGHILTSRAEKAMGNEYANLQGVFKNQNPITSLWRRYDYRFVPFSTGIYGQGTCSGKPKYTESKDLYPKLFWEQLTRCIKG